MKSSMFSMGPGRYRAIMAEISIRLEGFNSFMYRRIPALSNWNRSVVLPDESRSNVG